MKNKTKNFGKLSHELTTVIPVHCFGLLRFEALVLLSKIDKMAHFKHHTDVKHI